MQSIIKILILTFSILFSQESLSDTLVADSTQINDQLNDDIDTFVAKEKLGYSLGIASSVGIISGAAFTSVPVGVTAVITTPYGFDFGKLKYTVSLAFGGYAGSYNSADDGDYVLPDGSVHFTDDFNPILAAIGGNLTLANVIFTEGHVGLVGEGPGARGFAGISLELLMKNLKLPINVLVGGEGFISSKISGESASYWGGTGIRLDFNF